MDEIRYLTREEGIQLFDLHAKRRYGISGEEWLKNYDAGEYNDALSFANEVSLNDHCKAVDMHMLIPFVREVKA